MSYVIVPGIDNSGDEHWQTRWEAAWGPDATRIAPGSWEAPELDDWCAAIAAAVSRSGPQPVLVTHSLGCLAAAEWLTRNPVSARGAFFVAPPDEASPAFPRQAAPSFLGFARARLPVPGLIVASDDDPYCSPAGTRNLARSWDIPLVSVGAQGHLNSASGVGDWTAGRDLLTAFTAGLRAP